MEAELLQDKLEDKSLWYKYKTEVWSKNTPQTATVHNIMRVLRSIRNSGDFAYVSVAITSGKYLYEQSILHPELSKKDLLNSAISHNYNQGWNLIKDLKERRQVPVLYPADMVPIRQDWEQAHFQALWLSIIAEKCTEMHMSSGWEFSNGGSEEFTHVMQLRLGIPKHPQLIFYNTKESESSERKRMKNIKVYDCQGKPISLEDGIKSIEISSAWVKDKGFEPKRLNNCLELLYWSKCMIEKGFYQ